MVAREPLLPVRPVALGVEGVQLVEVVPQCRRIGDAPLVDGDGVPRRHDRPRQRQVVELVLRIEVRREGQDLGHAERADRVPDAQIGDDQLVAGGAPLLPPPLRLRLAGVQPGREAGAEHEAVLVVRVRGAVARAVPRDRVRDTVEVAAGWDAAAAQQAAERARGEGPAREPEDEELVARIVEQRDVAVRLLEVLGQAPAEQAPAPAVDGLGPRGGAAAAADPRQVQRHLHGAVGGGARGGERQLDHVRRELGVGSVPRPVAENRDPLHLETPMQQCLRVAQDPDSCNLRRSLPRNGRQLSRVAIFV